VQKVASELHHYLASQYEETWITLTKQGFPFPHCSLQLVSDLEIHVARALSTREKICSSLCLRFYRFVCRRRTFRILYCITTCIQFFCIFFIRFSQALAFFERISVPVPEIPPRFRCIIRIARLHLLYD